MRQGETAGRPERRPEAAPDLTIAKAAAQFGMRSSALRYYEEIGILPPPSRIGGQRRYDRSALRRLAILQRARQLGFTLKEMQILFADFSGGAPISQRWRELSQLKLAQLAEQIDHIHSMQEMLEKMSRCACTAFDQCGEGMLRRACARAPAGGAEAAE